MRAVDSAPQRMEFSVRFNLWSFGERVTVALGSLEGCSIVDVTSSCVLATQIADWGKNQQNDRKLFEGIDKILGDDGQHAVCPVCGECGYLLVGIPAGVCPECGREWSANEKLGTQEVATVRNGLVLTVVVTAVEIALCLMLDLFGAGDFLPWPLHGFLSAIFLLIVNLVTILAIFGLHRLVKRYLRR